MGSSVLVNGFVEWKIGVVLRVCFVGVREYERGSYWYYCTP